MHDGVVGFGAAALVTIVVGTGAGAAEDMGIGILEGIDEAAGAELTGPVPGAGALPVPSQTAGPGMAYEVAVMASEESMLKFMLGSVPEYAPGKATSAEAGGEAVPEPVTVNWAHSG